jgi:DNA polymerase III epsilon subunit-like protein
LVLVGNQQRPEVINAGKPEFAELAVEIWRFFEGAEILGYNALSFHVPLLAAEFARVAVSGATASDAEDGCDFQVTPV